MLKKLAIFLLLCCSVSSWANDEAQLRQIKTELWPKAYKTQDTQLLDSILHASFEMIDGNGKRSTRQQELDYVANNSWNPGDFEYVIERLQVFNGVTAIVDGTGKASKYSYKSSNFFIKQNGQWKAVASHVSGFKKH